ncbi:MAG TPA: trypsin-like peptidase domain-containing protein [Actinomycetota bacterium]|nr:trypsin-like peptidase domain-containing protein [Actinomycetota bacterium]
MTGKILAPALALGLLVAACTTEPPSQVRAEASPEQASPALISKVRGGPVVQVVRRVLPAVVNVTTDQLDPFGDTGQGTGTGFIVRPDGVVVTNYHVVERAQRIRVITSGQEPEEYDARVIGGDQAADLAVLKIDDAGLPTVSLGSSDALELGQQVVAIGYALALEGGPSVTTGIVSSMDRVIKAQDPNCAQDVCLGGQREYSHVIQTDAAINPGNSGGPLVNLAGQVVGINTAGIGAGFAENIGFAISIDAAKPTIEHAIENPEAAVAYLGVISRTVDSPLAIQYGLPVSEGAFVVAVAPDGPAAEAGIEQGDVVLGFDGHDVASSEELGDLIRSRSPGEEVEVRVDGLNGEKTVGVTLGVNPDPTR